MFPIWTIITILKISLVEYFYLISTSKRYYGEEYRTIHLLGTKCGRYTPNTLNSEIRKNAWSSSA